MEYSVTHCVGMPASHDSQRPHERSRETRTRSPTPMSAASTAAPTSVTTPATSCPNTAGRPPAPSAVHVDDVRVADRACKHLHADFAPPGRVEPQRFNRQRLAEFAGYRGPYLDGLRRHGSSGLRVSGNEGTRPPTPNHRLPRGRSTMPVGLTEGATPRRTEPFPSVRAASVRPVRVLEPCRESILAPFVAYVAAPPAVESTSSSRGVRRWRHAPVDPHRRDGSRLPLGGAGADTGAGHGGECALIASWFPAGRGRVSLPGG